MMKNIIVIVLLAIFCVSCIAFFTHTSICRNKSEIWFKNIDQDGPLLIDTLRFNSGKRPDYFDHPSYGVYIIYGNILKLLECFKVVPASRFSQLKESNDPLMLLPDIFYKSRGISIFISALCIVLFGAIFFILTKKLFFFGLGVFLFTFSGGLFYQSLFIRSELACVFLLLLSVLFIALEYKTENLILTRLYLLAGGFFLSMALLTKYQLFPALFFLPAYLFLSTTKKTMPEHLNFSKRERVFVGVIFLFIIKIIYHFYVVFLISTNRKTPFLYCLFLIIVIAGVVIVYFPRLYRFKIFIFHSKLALFLMGFLTSFVITSYIMHFDNRPVYSYSKDVEARILSYAFNPLLPTSAFGSKVFEGAKPFLSEFKHFLGYYTFSTCLFVIIFALTVLNLIFNKKLPSLISLLTLFFGIFLCFVSSFRYYAPHYLLYADVFIIGAVMFLIIQLTQVYHKIHRPWLKNTAFIIFCIILSGLILLAGLKQYRYLDLNYAAAGGPRNRADIVYELKTFSNYDDLKTEHYDYIELMLAKYGSADNVTRKVCNDPHLNGLDRGIDLRENQDAKNYYYKFFKNTWPQ